ncbi:PilX N-terminal domain-containing pilus assembly protein [Pseudomonas sp.]|uniref:pilus assembly PilX family protein n=1 Tax=Pseudomonas sp. TaxID=306 RepID=UPI00273351EE|nr:PilX N-terminal domain-containing pilus assembly protein [Pseudomonas sp.]MDP3813568.1 PilX N-terminal domain-containing pilus assembly protein [Pseudomonas sp.]
MPIKQQRGVVLLVCLVMLLLLTMIGLASISGSTLQERMVGGTRDYNTAFQAAEAALRVGEAHVRAQVEANADPASLFAATTDCPVLTAAQWTVPSNQQSTPRPPTCTVSNFYGAAGSSAPFICETDGSVAEDRAFDCLSRTFLFNVEASGFGSGEVEVRLRSTVAIAIRGQN